jgi:hypothetical protein
VSPAVPPESVARPRRLQAAFRGRSSRTDPSNRPCRANDAAGPTVSATIGQNPTPLAFLRLGSSRRAARHPNYLEFTDAKSVLQNKALETVAVKRSMARTTGYFRAIAGPACGAVCEVLSFRLPNACVSNFTGTSRGAVAVHPV